MADLQRNVDDDTHNPAVAATRALILYTKEGSENVDIKSHS